MKFQAEDARLDRISFHIILFDILFLPLFPLFSVSMSLPVMAYWYLARGRRTHFVKEYKMMPAVVAIMAFSILLGLLFQFDVRYETTLSTSIKRFFQFLTSFWYFLFFKYYFIKYGEEVKKYFMWEVIYIAFFALIYVLFQDLFIHYKAIINPADPHTRRFLSDELFGVYRYTFLWSDANNVGYAITGIALFYIVEESREYLKKYLVLALTFFILFCTMSIGGLGVGVVMMGVAFLFTDSFKNGKSGGILALLVFILLIAFVVIQYGEVISEFIDIGIESRLDKYSDMEDSSGGRLKDLQKAISHMSPLFLIIGSGLEGFTSENGHVYLIAAYGLPVYIYFMYLLFAKRKKISWKRYLPIVPFFVGFTMNIAIIDQKFLLILLLMSAYYSADSYRRKSKIQQI